MKLPTSSPWLRASLLLATLPLGILLLSAVWIAAQGEVGVVHVAPEQVAFFTAIFLSVPCGLFCLVASQRAYAAGTASGMTLGFGILLGVCNVLIGSAAWIGMFMMMEFVAHH